MNRLAAAFEDLIADAPDQWWAVFFPLWPDLEGEAAPDAPPARDVEMPAPAKGSDDSTGAAA
jgi:hypothetical protein